MVYHAALEFERVSMITAVEIRKNDEVGIFNLHHPYAILGHRIPKVSKKDVKNALSPYFSGNLPLEEEDCITRPYAVDTERQLCKRDRPATPYLLGHSILGQFSATGQHNQKRISDD